MWGGRVKCDVTSLRKKLFASLHFAVVVIPHGGASVAAGGTGGLLSPCLKAVSCLAFYSVVAGGT